MALNLPRLDQNQPLVKDNKTPSLPFHMWWQSVVSAIEVSFNQLQTVVINIQAALDAAGIALTAANAAQAAATTAQTAANTAQSAANGANDLTLVSNSGTDTNPLSASDAGSSATITIASHHRLYPDGTSLTVNAGSLTGLAYSTAYWVYYDDPSKLGGSVVYQSTTTEGTAAQAGTRYLVGNVTTPAALAAPTVGLYKKFPGLVTDV